ncbi:MAG: zf-HC2 domain-containing protein [Microbacteriaceae bacterium]
MTRRHHRRLSRLVDAWIDGELDGPQALAVATHVADCWDCSSAAETTRLVKHVLQGRARREPPAIASARLRRFAASLTS